MQSLRLKIYKKGVFISMILNTMTSNKKMLLSEGENFSSALYVIDKNKGLINSKQNGQALLQVLSGDVWFTQGNRKQRLSKEDFLSFDAKKAHSITADERSRIIMTVIKN